MDCVGKQWPISGYWTIACYLLTKYKGFVNKMKTFFIIMAFLGGFLSAGQLLMKPSPNIDTNDALNTYIMKPVYIPSLSCEVDDKKIDITNLDYYAKECFAIGPENIKMTFPSI